MSDRNTWAEDHPDATRLYRVRALATSLIGHATGPNEHSIEWFGLPEGWVIDDEPLEICQAFDAIVMRCAGCDWWCAANELDDHDRCSDCSEESDE